MPEERTERIAMVVGLSPGDESYDKTFETYDEYRYEAILVGMRPYRIIEVPNQPGTEIAIPAEPSEKIDLDAALAALNVLPEPGLVRRLTLVEDPHADQQWFRQQQNAPKLVIEAELKPSREIKIYGPALGGDLRSALRAQWCRLMRLVAPDAAEIHDLIGEIEPLTIDNVFAPGVLQPDLAWSLLGAHLVDEEGGGNALVDAVAVPVRSSVFGVALGERLNSLPAERRGSAHEAHALMVSWLAKITRPKALEALAAFQEGDDAESAAHANEIAAYLKAQPA